MLNLVKRVLLFSALFALLASAIAFILGHRETIISIIVGSIVSMASFAVLVIFISSISTGGKKALFIAIIGMLKMAVIGIVLWMLLKYNIVTPVAFLLGFSTTVASLLVEGVRHK